MKKCSICQQEYDESVQSSLLVEAGAWLSDEFWQDAGDICTQCLENRARLAMMYIIDR